MKFLGRWVLWVQLRKPWAETLDFPILGRFQANPMMTTVTALSNPISSRVFEKAYSFISTKLSCSAPPFFDAWERDRLRETDDTRETFAEGAKFDTSSSASSRVEIKAVESDIDVGENEQKKGVPTRKKVKKGSPSIDKPESSKLYLYLSLE